jgi:hypothetical protein
MDYSVAMKQINKVVYSLITCLGLLLIAVAARADDPEHLMGQGVSFAAGIGAEVSRGDYGVNADATVATVPLVVVVNPVESIDLNFEVPMVFLSSRSGSGVVVTQSGGAGRRHGTESTTSTTTTTTATVTESGLGDVSLSAGWTILADSTTMPKIRPTLYLKVPTGDKDRGLGTGTYEVGPGLSVSKWLGDVQLFAEGAYILQNSTSTYEGKNYVSYSAGGGVQISDRLFASLYTKGTSAKVDEGTASAEGRLKLNFQQSRRIAWEVYALAGFTDASPDAGGGLLLMYQF